ncbi:DUF4834 family protein [Mucilaginibacter limnophilus]|uniref:DUF4834 family protein n=1 Tax=Mucilaginibacter limnophilus TaxID=1932778 RepID=A0A437MW27_9SPHI|nr:DUF4834 family protein [Mucilaginibacter limnophilus]RVU01872.1 DUF4834 family protein [Mucilaginibacter limnophilus]
MALIRFLLISIAVLYIFRVVARLLLPMFFQTIVKKAQQQQQHNPYNNYQQQRKPEGTVKVDYVPEGKRSQVPDTEGEFVEYEEIKK